MKELKSLETFSNFKVIPLTIPPLSIVHENIQHLHPYTPISPQSLPIIHYLYMRAHDSSKNNKSSFPSDKTLFLVNLPIDTTIAHLKRLFRRCGTIEKFIYKPNNDIVDESVSDGFAKKRSLLQSGGKGYVVFVEDDAVDKAICMRERKRAWSDVFENVLDDSMDVETSIEPKNDLGLMSWIHDYLYCIPDADELEHKVNSELLQFEEFEARMKAEALSKRNVPDADGFVTVTRARGRRNTNKDGQGATVVAANADSVKDLKPKDHSLDDFYRFQKRENKRNQLADLRRKFEEDKLKIAELKKNRKFKPY